ncbi:MAG TPA: PQQ-binding-like beta-propeller repeat protein [Bryobacteraceae bacterium]
MGRRSCSYGASRQYWRLFNFAVLLAAVSICRARQAEYKTISAAKTSELTPSLSTETREYTTWYRSYGDSAGTRYSSLKQIDTDNVARLRVAWVYHSADGKGNIECNPVVANGTIYAPTAGNYIVAIDGATGKEKWRFKPEGHPAFRGLEYWPGDGKTGARLFFPSGDWFYALNPKDGRPVTTFGQNGRVRARAVVAPVSYRKLIILACWNEVRAFDIETGAAEWTFHLIPQPGEFGHETWTSGGVWTGAYGANSWGGMALDEQRGIVYVSAGSPHPNYLGMHHPGDNLFSDCVVALKADTGTRLWHFQEIRHDIWDLDIPAPPNLVTVTRGGRRYDAIAQVTKIGNTLLLDRLTGKPLFPFRLRRAPASILEGEETAAWQPDLQLPQPFAPQEFSLNDVTDLSPQAHAFVLDELAGAEFGWFRPFNDGKPLVFYGMLGGAEWTGAAFDPTSSLFYVSANKLPWVVKISRVRLLPKRKAPFTDGNLTYLRYCGPCHGAERDGAGMAPPLFTVPGRLRDSQLTSVMRNGKGAMPAVEVPAGKMSALLDFLEERDLAKATIDTEAGPRYEYKFDGYHTLLDRDGHPGVKPPWGTLNAINLNTGKIAWRVPLGEYDELTKQGIPKTGTENFGGPIVTAGGLVFCAGTLDLKIRAFNSKTGEELWQSKLPFGGFAPPSTYMVGGKQYVVISATGGGKLRGELGDVYIAFSLP